MFLADAPASSQAGGSGGLSRDRSATMRCPPPLIEVLASMILEAADAAAQLERDYPGYHVWTSDAGWWYATRRQPWARGQSATVHGPGPRELAVALAAEEAVTIGCAMTGAW